MQFTPANKSDIHKYYVHTFVKFKSHAIESQLNPDTLFLIDSVDGSRVTGTCEDGNQFVIWLSDKHPFEADYVLPHKSFFQNGKYAVLLERIPAQQYYRGLCSENVKMTYQVGAAAVKSFNIDFHSLKAFVTKQSFYSLAGAIKADGQYTCVLHPRMQYNRENKMICVDHIAIAKVDPDHMTIHMLKPIFKEEVVELLKAYGDENFKFTSDLKKNKEVIKVAKEVTL